MTERKDLGTPESPEDLVSQIREDYRYHKEYWRENYAEGEKDMLCAAAEPPDDFKQDRVGRPCLWPDEISQYIKQANNNLRLNKRSVKISPRGDGATDKDATHRQAYIRGIEYASKAQSIYTTGFESCAECGFGYWRVTVRVTGPKGELEPRLVRIPNQFTVLPDPETREADRSDMMRCFVTDTMREKTFARRFPKAKKRSFTMDDRGEASDWFSGENITIAEYWTRESIELEDGEPGYKVRQYLTNGLEILPNQGKDYIEWVGSWIPIIGVYGEELYIRDAGQSKLRILSLIRRARVPQQMLAYVASQEAEEFGMMPRAALQGWEGMFDPEAHKYIHKVPTAYLEFKLPSQELWNPQWGAPPMPTRAQFTPNPQAYELSYERWRRAIQAAMGVGNLPTAAQRLNEKSGAALEKIQNQQAVGSFHINDNFTRALGNTGMQLNELITKLAKNNKLPAQILGKDQKDEDQLLQIADPEMQDLPASSEHLAESEYFFAHRGQFEVTISDGAYQPSQREEQSDFVDHLLTVLPTLGLPPALMQQVLSVAIKLKNIGTYGQEIADLLSPPDPSKLPPQAKAIMAQMQGQMQQLQQELQKLQMEKLGKVTENQGKLAIVQAEGQVKMAEADKDRETKMAVAEITALKERVGAAEDMMQQLHSQAHELALQMQSQQHEKELAAQNAQHAQDAQAQAAEHAQTQQATQIQADQQQAQAAQEAQQQEGQTGQSS